MEFANRKADMGKWFQVTIDGDVTEPAWRSALSGRLEGPRCADGKPTRLDSDVPLLRRRRY